MQEVPRFGIHGNGWEHALLCNDYLLAISDSEFLILFSDMDCKANAPKTRQLGC